MHCIPLAFSNTQHYAIYTCAIGSCLPSRHLRWLDAPLVDIMDVLRLLEGGADHAPKGEHKVATLNSNSRVAAQREESVEDHEILHGTQSVENTTHCLTALTSQL